ncbi:membrane-associated protein, putative [Bodo saltans]|uniref:Membrane-associated protein, putative n=1 Tax=Bodo saltans TaxID=75058 RepID=A0A0S4KJS2_BODSA|nr:membrane-associated protein, putative [Bodo saltans]|eukprot:CUI14800.1 membrane-associated protein, putative [Bodo saltans]
MRARYIMGAVLIIVSMVSTGYWFPTGIGGNWGRQPSRARILLSSSQSTTPQQQQGASMAALRAGSTEETRSVVDDRAVITQFDFRMPCTAQGRLADDACIVVMSSSSVVPPPSSLHQQQFHEPADQMDRVEGGRQHKHHSRSNSTFSSSNNNTDDKQNLLSENPAAPPAAAAACLLKLWRSVEVGCARATTTTPVAKQQQQQGGDDHAPKPLCSCANKRVVAVPLVSILANLLPCSGCTQIDSMIAVTKFPPPQPPTTADPNNQTRHIASPDGRSFYLIDASTSELGFLTCWKGETKIVSRLHPKFTQLMSHLFASEHNKSSSPHNSESHPTSKFDPPPALNKTAASPRRPWSCSVLQTHRLARGGNHNDLRAGEAAPPVYYALDHLSGVAGHVLEELTNGIGQYVAEGLRERQIPWLVPCSDAWENRSPGDLAPLIWTEFFLELNDEALQFPFYPVDFHKHFNVDSPSFSPLVFSTVHFASAQLGLNALCFRKILQSLLWRHAVRLEGERNWSVTSQNQLEAQYKLMPRSAASDQATLLSSTSLQEQNVTVTIKSSSRNIQSSCRNCIAVLKILKKHSHSTSSLVITSPGRSYIYSLSFERLLLERGIHQLHLALPLFERMWHVNNAELIVTTWGSTTTTVMNLLFERQTRHNNNSNNRTNNNDYGDGASSSSSSPLTLLERPLRLLVLVHPSYCHEAIGVFQVTMKFLCDPRRLPKSSSSRLLTTIPRREVSRSLGDVADYYGGQNFCIMYAFTHSLKFVGNRELDFKC